MMNGKQLDKLCWILVSQRDRWYPPDETAEECVGETGNSIEYEEGYHLGWFLATDEMVGHLYSFGINVLGRANRYTHIHRENGAEFRNPDEPDYYHAVEHGSEFDQMEYHANDSPIQIESIEWPAQYSVDL